MAAVSVLTMNYPGYQQWNQSMHTASNGRIRHAVRYALGIAPATHWGDPAFFALCAQQPNSTISLEQAESYSPEADLDHVADRAARAYRRARDRNHSVPVHISVCRWWSDPAHLTALDNALRSAFGPFVQVRAMNTMDEDAPDSPAARALAAAFEQLDPDRTASLAAFAEVADKRATWYT